MSDNFHKYILRNSQISFLKNKFFLGSYPFFWGRYPFLWGRYPYFAGVDTHFLGSIPIFYWGLIPIFSWGRYTFIGFNTHILLGLIPVFKNLKTTITSKNIRTMYLYEYDCYNRYIQRSM